MALQIRFNITKRVDVEEVVSVYSGKAHKCCCGCSGKHTYAAKFQPYGKEIRGYEIDADEVSDKTVARISKLINEALQRTKDGFSVMENGKAIEEVDIADTYTAVTINDHLYIAYTERGEKVDAIKAMLKAQAEVA